MPTSWARFATSGTTSGTITYYARAAKLFEVCGSRFLTWFKERTVSSTVEVTIMRLLIADDEKELVNALTAILRHNNYSVDAVYNGADALDYLQADNYDGAVLDIMMPRLDGISVLRQLRSSGKDTPVLMLTAKSEIDDRVLGLDCGADDYLAKPFATKELLARIRAMTRRRGELTDNLLEFGNITLDRASFELHSPTDSCRLAGKEFQMLEQLMLTPNHPISAERFMEKIWGYDAQAEINVVWVYVSYLRKRLEGLSANVKIRSARGAGYLLEVEK